ncbi:MAG: alpha/beta hydrolase [Clostridia bacterium]|nr:alpha/beta hydrolase [Clostridia bacterium]
MKINETPPCGFIPGNPDRLLVVIAGNTENTAYLSGFDPSLASIVTVPAEDWNRDLSPWPAPACFRGGEAFSGNADAFLSRLITQILPEAERKMHISPKIRAIAGYSLAGLFSLYALTKTELFQMAASVSGSLWFDGFLDYIIAHPPLAENPRVYLSLGDKEALTKNKRLQSVEEMTMKAYDFMRSRNISAHFELNPGNHFANPDQRMMKAINFLFE